MRPARQMKPTKNGADRLPLLLDAPRCRGRWFRRWSRWSGCRWCRGHLADFNSLLSRQLHGPFNRNANFLHLLSIWLNPLITLITTQLISPLRPRCFKFFKTLIHHLFVVLNRFDMEIHHACRNNQRHKNDDACKRQEPCAARFWVVKLNRKIGWLGAHRSLFNSSQTEGFQPTAGRCDTATRFGSIVKVLRRA